MCLLVCQVPWEGGLDRAGASTLGSLALASPSASAKAYLSGSSRPGLLPFTPSLPTQPCLAPSPPLPPPAWALDCGDWWLWNYFKSSSRPTLLRKLCYWPPAPACPAWNADWIGSWPGWGVGTDRYKAGVRGQKAVLVQSLPPPQPCRPTAL